MFLILYKRVILYKDMIIEGGILMNLIIPIKGAVKFNITLDPTCLDF